MSKPIWEGVYKSFRDAPSSGPGFSGERWIQNSLEKINAVRQDAIDEVINAMTRQNYYLVFKSAYVATILGQEREIPQDNFEEQYRLGHTCSLLFAKRDSYD